MNKNVKIFAFADEAGGNIDHQIEALLRNGLSGIEIRNTEYGNISDLNAEQAKEIMKKLSDNGLVCWSLGSPIGKISIEGDDFEKHLDKLKNTLDISGELNCNNMRMFSFYLPHDKNPEDYKEKVIERLHKMCELAKPYNMNMCHENEKGIFGDIPERCLELLNAVPELKNVFDPANYIQCNVDTKAGWELLKDKTVYMHIKDALKDGRVVPAGKGDGNVGYIANDFIARGGECFTIEPHLKVFKGLAELERAGEESKVGELYTYETSDLAFDAACEAFKSLIR